MTPDRWHLVEELFNAALSMPARLRENWLSQQCGGDLDLFRTVVEMVEADDGHCLTGSPIEGAIQKIASSVLERDGIGHAPRRVGAYEVLKEIGSGGMSTVYLATRADDQYRKEVAVKLIHRGLAKDSTLERFLQERQILANLDHPYVARLIDGGAAADGRPYLILEYVEGTPITEYCSRNVIGMHDRCRLFLKVCEAVAYAHQNLIIHRDLKPGNILVSANGVPKLLDFGIAKLMDDQDTTRDPITRAATSLMTPEYASPEQVRGQPVTTATDVYSLGAVLFEVLSGERAQSVGSSSPTEMVRIICEREMTRPSRVSKERISQDLDNIVLKAMEKDPRRRYGSVEQMAEDVRRYLDHRPVKARGSSPLYVARKFVVRHWIPVAALIVTVTAMAGGTVMARREAAEAVKQRDRAEVEKSRAEHAAAEAQRERHNAQRSASEAERQRGRAAQRFEQMRTLIHRFLFEIDHAVQDLPGTSPARRTVAKTAVEYLDGMSKEKIEDPVLRRDLAVAYERVGELQGSGAKPSLGDVDGAMISYRKAMAIRRSLPLDSAQSRREMMKLYGNLAMSKGATNRTDAAAILEEGMNLANGRWRSDPGVADALGGLLYQAAQYRQTSAGSIRDYREAESIFVHLIDEKFREGSKDALIALSMTRMHLGRQLYLTGDFANALPTLHRSVESMEELVRQDELNTRLKRNLGICLYYLGSAYMDRTGGSFRNFEQALRFTTRSSELFEGMAAADPSNHTTQRDFIRGISYVGRAHAAFDKWEETIRHYSDALNRLDALGKVTPGDRTLEDDTAVFLVERGTAEFKLGKLDEAELHTKRAKTIWEERLAAGSGNRAHRFNIALSIRRLGEIAAARGNREEGRRLHLDALSVFEELANADKNYTAFQYQIRVTNDGLAKLDALAEKRKQ